MSYQPKVALVHDDFMQSGGAESLFATIASLYPKAPIFTSLVDWSKLPLPIDNKRIKVSFLQKIPLVKYFYKALLPFYPLAFESFRFEDYDLVISSTTRFAKSIITKPQTIHICYINSLPRFLYNDIAQSDYLPDIVRKFTNPLFKWLQRWDKASSYRVDFYIANSQNIGEKVLKNYGYESETIYPFADLNFYNIPKVHNWQLKSQKYFLAVTRLVKWKKIEIAIKAAKELSFNLKIVGTGPDDSRLKKLSSVNNVEFFGKVSRETLRELYQNAKGLIVTQEEDFGIAAVEAQACGCPVIAYKKGGAAEIVKDLETGIFYEKQTGESLKDAIKTYSRVKWESTACRRNSLRFSQAEFVKAFKKSITTHASRS